MSTLPYDRESKYEDPDIVARYDRRYMDRVGRWNNALVRRALDRALRGETLESKFVLDVPWGTGRLSAWIEANGGRCIAGDHSFAMLRAGGDRARETGATRLRLDAFHLPFPDRCEALGAAVSARFLHLLDGIEREAFLRELARVVEGPLLVLFYPNHTIKAVSRWLRRRLGRRASDRTPWIPWKTFRAEIERAGLMIEKRIPVWRGLVSANVVRLRARHLLRSNPDYS